MGCVFGKEIAAHEGRDKGGRREKESLGVESGRKADVVSIADVVSGYMAEAVAPGMGVLLARQLGFENIELECDALEVVKAICSGLKWRALYDLIIEDMCLLESSFTYVIMSKGVVMMLHA
uniref:RNase H type-1 domain-containing protein n=1 Tax=Chenopodium quinoa TaxID=63459 RepID=A0A803N9A8_CHEQI